MIELDAHQSVCEIMGMDLCFISLSKPGITVEKENGRIQDPQQGFIVGLRERYCIDPDASRLLKDGYAVRIHAVVFLFDCYKRKGVVIYDNR